MKEVFLAIEDCLKAFFDKTSTYNIIDNKQFVVDTNKQFIFGINYPQLEKTPKTLMPKNGEPIAISEPKDFTRIYFVPKATNFINTRAFESNISGNTGQKQLTYYSDYLASFDLILYSKSQRANFTTEAFQFQELFFNVFRGHAPYVPILRAKNVWDLGFENLEVRDLSFVENTHGVSRYQASFNAKFSKTHAGGVIDKATNIKIHNLETICK